MLAYTDKDGPGLRQILAGAHLRFGKCRSKFLIDPHDLTGRFHFGAQQRIHIRKTVKRQNRLLDRNMLRSDFACNSQIFQSASQHDFGGQLRQGSAGSLADKGNRSGGAGVYLQNIKLIIFDGILDIHQSHHVQFGCHGLCRPHNFRTHRRTQTVRRKHTGGIAGMHAGLLDMFHDAADNSGFSIRNRIHINFNRIFQKFIDQHRVFGRRADGQARKIGQIFFVVDDLHGPSAQHI